MLYITCPTCGYFLGQKTIEYEQQKESICANPNLSTEQKEKDLSALLIKLGLRRYCCKMRVMSYKNLVDYILPAEQS
jgi:DNA-directed RNA polymerase subunit N (RpoN/RPB10)